MWWSLVKQFWPVLPTLALCWYLHHAAVIEIEAQQRIAVQTQITSDTHQCNMDKELTANVESQKENEISVLHSQLSSLRRVRPRQCIIGLPSTIAANRFNSGQSTSKLPVAYGVVSDALYSFAADCDKTDIKLRECESLLSGIYSQNGQNGQ